MASVANGLGARVALVRSRYNPHGGAERFVSGALASLRREGAALTIITRHWEGHDGSALVIDPFHVGSLWRDWGFARAVCRQLARQHFDLVQSHERIACCDIYRAGDGVHAEWLRQRARVQSPLARWATCASPHHRYLLAAERAVFTGERVRAVICNSEMVRAEIRAQFGTAPARLALIRNAVDSATFHPGLRVGQRSAVRQQLGIPGEARVVAYVGSGFERKGVAALLSAVALARSRPWAIVVGRDKRSPRYAARARELGIAQRVRFVGAASDVRPYHAAADAFALPALYDPFPNAALEAMASGLPVITSTKCGVAELIREGENGFVRDALDVAGLAEALDRLDPAECARMGAAARDAVAPLTPQAMAREFVALYERLLRR